jgi:acyl-CoA synthetase (AMP-forming)/AMP-acid ligase II
LCRHEQSDVILNWLPFDHIGSISDWHLRCVELGCRLIYAPTQQVLGNPLNWLRLIHQYRITHSWAPNFAYTLINEALQGHPQADWDLSCVKSLLTAGEPVSSETVNDFLSRLTPYGLPRTALRPAFGMAELGSGITYFQPTEETPVMIHSVDRASLTGSLVRVEPNHPQSIAFTSLGPVIPGVSIRIVNDHDSVLPENTIGHLQVQGAAVSPGYYKDPEANEQVFLKDGWFNTGDRGFIANAQLYVTGRDKETVIINGVNYYSREIELAVEEVDGIAASFTAACAVRPWNADTEQLAIFFHSPIADDARLVQLIRNIQAHVTKKVGVKPD